MNLLLILIKSLGKAQLSLAIFKLHMTLFFSDYYSKPEQAFPVFILNDLAQSRGED